MIGKKIKYLPNAEVPQGYEGTISEYCQEYPDDLTRCYRNLCPYLDPVSAEPIEQDTQSQASVGPTDTSDAWIINFSVPAIFGYAAQAHVGGVIDSSGEYGCDVSIDIIEQ